MDLNDFLADLSSIAGQPDPIGRNALLSRILKTLILIQQGQLSAERKNEFFRAQVETKLISLDAHIYRLKEILAPEKRGRGRPKKLVKGAK